ncbi:MAG: ABC transporter ATP-binding protein [Flavobacteriaceae bacterium]|nr:ABC transporter ATP-binding protein [Flavobacteriaceae bacterium]
MKEQQQHIVLEVNELVIGYQSKKRVAEIAHNINFSLKKGELIGLIGSNGIGKSTLIKTLTKSLSKLSGKIQINGKAIESYDANSLAQQLSVVFSKKTISSNLTVEEVIALGRQPYTNWIGSITQQDLNKIEEVLELIQIQDLRSKKCHELSDGQLQKVMLARAFAQDTDLIILDEPTTHLDLYHKVYILKLLKRLAETTQKTILFSTHEINVALSLCDQLIVMKKEGTLFGTPEELTQTSSLNDLFPEDLIYFDLASKTFKVK